MDILGKITQMRIEKGWTEYELAERAELTQSTISSWYRKNLFLQFLLWNIFVMLLALHFLSFL